jgi:hypothetical protein
LLGCMALILIRKDIFLQVVSPQETQYLGLGCGPIDPDGAPAGVEVVETKADLQTYITGISTTWTVDSEGVTGIRTETTTGTLEAWNPPSGIDGEEYSWSWSDDHHNCFCDL